jgi:hypothetical protein
MKEPSVLDYFKSILTPWKGPPIESPFAESEDESQQESETDPLSESRITLEPPLESPEDHSKEPEPYKDPVSWPWHALFGLFVALAAQWAFAPVNRSPYLGGLLLVISIVFVVWAYILKEWRLNPSPLLESRIDPISVDVLSLGIGGTLLGLTYFTSSGGLFTLLNVSLWFLSILFLMRAFWLSYDVPIRKRLAQFIRTPSRRRWQLNLSSWTLLILFGIALVLFFRIYQLGLVPPEMVSDHAEKYLDVSDILKGQTRIFFPRNGGREALQFYLLAALHILFNVGQNFLTLKISSVIVGLMALPFLYLLGKEVGNRRIGLLAFIFVGIAYWPNVISRVGMRLPFYILFTAATLYLFLRGIRTSNRNYFLGAGISLGLSLYGYSADRILPIVLVLAAVIYLLHKESKGNRQQFIWHFLLLVLMAFTVFTPLFRYITEDPEGFSYRMFSRMGSIEQTLPGEPLEIFLDNLLRALGMFSGSNGIIWPISIPDYPALGIVSGALFYIGVVLILIRYIKQRHWLDLFLLLSIPVLMLPSILSLAFPSENPNLHRTGGALVPVFLISAYALDGLMSSLEVKLRRPWGKRVAWGLFILLLGWSALQNYDLVFNKYYRQYQLSAWNTSEMGTVIRDFADTIGSPDSAWVIGFPHWADTRLVAINAGFPEIDYAIFVEELDHTLSDPRSKLFIINPQDNDSIEMLPELYPEGWFDVYNSAVETKNFLMFTVPPLEKD